MLCTDSGAIREFEEARCLFCLTGMEYNVLQKINAMYGVRAIVPTKVKRFKAFGGWKEEQKLLFPSYVFAYSQRGFPFASLERIPDVVRIIRYENDDGVLKGADAVFAKTLWDLDGKIGVMKAVREGERVEITDGVFKALKGRVVAMDRRKMTAKVELSVVGSTLSAWLSYEVMDVLGLDDKAEMENEAAPEHNASFQA